MISHSNLGPGAQARNRLDEARDPGVKGALAALNQRDPHTLAAIIADDAGGTHALFAGREHALTQ